MFLSVYLLQVKKQHTHTWLFVFESSGLLRMRNVKYENKVEKKSETGT